MQTNPASEISASDLAVARELLTSDRPADGDARPVASAAANETRGTVTIHHGITRARTRSAAKTSATA